MADVSHQWTVDVAAHLDAKQALAIATGRSVKVTIEAKPDAVYCRRCWALFDPRGKSTTCLDSAREG